jgi:hypothetical protein
LAFQNQEHDDSHIESKIAKTIGADKVIYNDTITLAQELVLMRMVCFLVQLEITSP